MMQYDGDLHIPKNFLVNPPEIDRTVSQYLCDDGVTSFAISETQKSPRNLFLEWQPIGYIDPALETYIEIPSDKIEFDKAPRMKAYKSPIKPSSCCAQTAFGLAGSICQWRYGRSQRGDGAAIVAVETVDTCVGSCCKRSKTRRHCRHHC
jgi:2,3-bisphosphoglycerate-independent phosphoglycerate mutase